LNPRRIGVAFLKDWLHFGARFHLRIGLTFRPMDHLRYAGLAFKDQQQALKEIIYAEPLLMALLEDLREFDLPDWLLVSGAIYNNVWNVLTGRPLMTGVKDFDVFYFDDRDLSYEAEDAIVKQAEKRFSHLPVPVEVRNQARVHLWAPRKFGHPVLPLNSSAEMLGRFASKTHSVGVRLGQSDKLDIVAPFGLEAIFAFRIVPNHVLDNRHAHEKKGARAKAIWPQLVVEPW
jgi:uncharacterized protein